MDMEETKKETKKKHKKKNRFASGFFTLAIVVCLGVMGFSGYKLISTWLEYREGDQEYESLRQYTAVVEPEEEQEEVEELPEEEVIPEEIDESDLRTRRRPPIDVDWKSLREINDEIVGWIYIGAIDVSYPVVHGADDDYYLHRTFERADNFAGSIFVEAENKGDFSDPNTIIYGHNMNNGSMFGSLKVLINQEKYKEDPYFWILTPRGNFRYKMFSMHVTATSSDVYTLFNGVDKKFIEWCESMKKASTVDLGEQEFTLHSKIATLSTCTGDSSTRFVVQGVAVRE